MLSYPARSNIFMFIFFIYISLVSIPIVGAVSLLKSAFINLLIIVVFPDPSSPTKANLTSFSYENKMFHTFDSQFPIILINLINYLNTR